MGDATVTAVTADAITLRTEGGATQRVYRKPRKWQGSEMMSEQSDGRDTPAPTAAALRMRRHRERRRDGLRCMTIELRENGGHGRLFERVSSATMRVTI